MTALALRLDRVVLDTQPVEQEYLLRVVSLCAKFGRSRLFVSRQVQIANRLMTSREPFYGGLGAARWLNLTAEVIDRCRIPMTAELVAEVDALVAAVDSVKVEQPLGFQRLIELAVEREFRVFGFAYGNQAAYRRALAQAGIHDYLTDVYLGAEPESGEWTEFWERHECIASQDTDDSDRLLIVTPDPVYDPGNAFSIGASCLLFGRYGQGLELPAVQGMASLTQFLSTHWPPQA